MRISRVILLVVGVLLTIGAVAALMFSEYRYRTRTGDMGWIRDRVVSIPADTVQSKWEGRLVHLQGRLEAEGKRRDPVFHVERDAVSMDRRVEMYQWKEIEYRHEDRASDYEYRRIWSDDRIDSDRFVDKSRDNPEIPISEDTFLPSRATLGAYRVSDLVLTQFQPEVAPLESGMLEEIPDKFASRAELTHVGGGSPDKLNALCIRANGTSPPCGDEVGDVRVRWEIQPEGHATVIAGVEGDRLVPFDHPKLDRMGVMTASQKKPVDEIIGEDVDHMRSMAWTVRCIGLGFFLVGLFLPLQAFRDEQIALPVLGKLEQYQVFVWAGVGSVVVTFATVGVGWVAFA